MDQRLGDLLTKLLGPRLSQASFPERADICSAYFYEYLHAMGIEHCNYGGFELLADGRGEVNEFSGSRLPPSFLEEFTHELAEEDYTLLKAAEISPANPVTAFELGVDHLDEIEAFNPASRQVQEECARYGIVDGVALLGDTSLGSAGGGRYFGFVFAGARGTGELVRGAFTDLQVAAFAMLDRMKPQFEATIDRFRYDLTPREKDMLAAVASGQQRGQIAHGLGIAVTTVDMHLANLRRKLGAQTLAEAVARGYRYGVL